MKCEVLMDESGRLVRGEPDGISMIKEIVSESSANIERLIKIIIDTGSKPDNESKAIAV